MRDRETGIRRAVRPGDIAVLFRTREGHREFEEALAPARMPSYVYKGLGFFDADEIKDVLALLRSLRPESELRAAAVAAIARRSAVGSRPSTRSSSGPDLPHSVGRGAAGVELMEVRRVLESGCSPSSVVRAGWLLVDRLPPAELLDRILARVCVRVGNRRSASYRQARENLKKIRSLVRRLQNRGYLTLGRIVDHFAELVSAGDESNAVVDAVDAVNLMTMHAAKGLEFPDRLPRQPGEGHERAPAADSGGRSRRYP